jgi:phage gpG-like protein
MPAEMLHIEVDSRPVMDALARLRDAGADMEPIMRDIGTTLEERVGERFERFTDPLGGRWKAKKSGAPSKLYDSGQMLDSLGSEADADHVDVGFGQTYAVYHEFGTRKMARRGLLFADPNARTLAPDDERLILGRLEAHLKKHLPGG